MTRVVVPEHMASSLFQVQHASSSTMPFTSSSSSSIFTGASTVRTLGFLDLPRTRTVAFNSVVLFHFSFSLSLSFLFCYIIFLLLLFTLYAFLFYFFILARNVICLKLRIYLTGNRLFPFYPSSWSLQKLRKQLIETVPS